MQTTSILAKAKYIMFKENVMKLSLESVQQTVWPQLFLLYKYIGGI